MLEARSAGSHCGGQKTAWSTSASLLATQSFVVFGTKAKAKATPMRTTSARELDACLSAYRFRCGGFRVHGRCMAWLHGMGLCEWGGGGRLCALHLRGTLREAERHVVHLSIVT